MTNATVITDASFCPRTLASGWGAWIRVDGLEPIKKSGVFKREVETPTQAELYASLNGLFFAIQNGANTILIQTDCLAVVNVINGISKRHSATSILWRESLKGISSAGCRISAKHVKGHSDTKDARSYVNRWCDARAREHMRNARGVLNR